MKLYRILGMSAVAVGLCAGGFAQSVTVNSNGGADFTSISLALAAVQADPSGPDVITIQNAGPFIEPSSLLVTGDVTGVPASPSNDITIQAASPAIRPILMSNASTRVIFVNKIGNATIRDLIIMPWSHANNSAKVFDVDDVATATTAAGGYNVTLRNMLVTSNDGTSQPLGSLDGMTSPTFNPNMKSFTGDVLNAASNVNTQINKLYCYDIIITGLLGNNVNGFRGFPDGATGTEWVVGEGCVMSYCQATGTGTRGCWQPGGDAGSVDIVKLLGTQAKPVKFVNNTNINAIWVTGTGQANNKLTCQYLFAVNNTGNAAGFVGMKTDQQDTFTSCTFINNGTANFPQRERTFQQSTNFTQPTVCSNVIIGGVGSDETSNTIYCPSSNANGQLQLNQCAVVLNGTYRLDTSGVTGGDGIIDNTPTSNVVATGVLNSDPVFASLDPANPNFGVVTNSAYATAGPAGFPLTGAGSYNATAGVRDWQRFE